jgi:tellurite methyltransferase
MPHSPLIAAFQTHFSRQGKPILDLACGLGRNGLYLHTQGFSVQFADKNGQSLATLQSKHQIQTHHCLHVDFETGQPVLTPNRYQAILVFRYLHRPLMQQIKDAVEPGGLIIYETFTTENRQFGRPNRDDFLLQKKELKAIFEDWECLHYFEGLKHNPERAIAQIVCKKS